MRISMRVVVATVACGTVALSLATLSPGVASGNPASSPLARAVAHTSAMSADEGTNRGGLSRDGWYPEASLLTPTNVAQDGFGPLFSVPVTGEVYAQPVMDQSEVIVATEQNWVYAINQITGARQWSVQLGANVGAQPFNDQAPTVSSLAPWECNDLDPYVGVTSTPVVDPSTGVIYVVAMEQLSDGTLGYFLHALDPKSGLEEPNFPVEIKGAAQNDPEVVFNAYEELQRVALTLTNGVVYFGFSSHCDSLPYQGYVAGVSVTGHLTTLWTDLTSGTPNGGGIWQTGGGFASDAPGQLLVASGNGLAGDSPSGVIPGRSPPTTGSLTESTLRLVTQRDGSLSATDFFTPYDAATLDSADLDLGTGSPVLLPSQFGTTADPNLLVQAGKEGYVYLLNAQSLGGVSPGDAGTLTETGTYGASWATPGVWPGDGGYIYIPSANGGSQSLGNATQGDFNVFQVDKPVAPSSSFHLRLVAKDNQAVGFGTSSPIITSDGTTPGSAVVWIVQLPDGSGTEANLQAYNAVPTPGTGLGTLTLINQWPIANATKFAVPGVGDNRLYVPTKDGQLLVFGLNSPSIVSGHGATFTATTIGRVTKRTLMFHATSAMTIDASAGSCGVCTRTSQFKAVVTSPAFHGGRLTLNAGQAITVSARFQPTVVNGFRSDVLRMVTSLGEADFTLGGTGRAAGPWVTPSTRGLTLPNYFVGSRRAATSTVTFTNFGARPATITSYGRAGSPFRVSGIPHVGATIAPGASFTAKVSFSSISPGTFRGTLVVATNSPTSVKRSVIQLSAVASTPAQVAILPGSLALSFGSSAAPIPVGAGDVETVAVSNVGGSILTLSSVATTASFLLLNPPPTNYEIPPGAQVDLHVLFLPSAAGTTTSTLVISPLGLAPSTVLLTGYGVGTGYAIPPPGTAGWGLAGSASMTGKTLRLTPNLPSQVGAAFWSTPVSSGAFTASFTAMASLGIGGDGEALVLADTSTLGSPPPPLLGRGGDQVGFGGIRGLAVVVGDFTDPGTPGTRWVGVADGVDNSTGGLHWVSAPVGLSVSTQDTPNVVTVVLFQSTLDVWVDGSLAIDLAVSAPPSFVLGFTAGTGLFSNQHDVSDASIEVAGAPPT